MIRVLTDKVLIMAIIICSIYINLCNNIVMGEEANKLLHINIPENDRVKVEHIYRNVEWHQWIKTDSLRTMPKVDESLLSHPDLVTNKTINYITGQFKNNSGLIVHMIWQNLIPNLETMPHGSPPADVREKLLERLPPGINANPDMVEEFLTRKYELYRRSKMKRSGGQIDIKICVASSSEAVHEYLLYDNAICSRPEEIIANDFNNSRRIQDIGSIAFRSETQKNCTIHFSRDNIGVIISAHGVFVNQAMPLARKIDNRIKKQQLYSSEQYLARKPIININDQAVKVVAPGIEGQFTLDCTVNTPHGVEAIVFKAKLNGQPTQVKDGKIQIYIPYYDEVAKNDNSIKIIVELTVITNEYLFSILTKEINIIELQ